MGKEITYREYIVSDYQYLIDIMDKAWGYSQFYSEKLGNLMAEHDLLERLALCTFSCVALDGERPVGFFLGRRMDGICNVTYAEHAREVLDAMKPNLGAPVYALINSRIKEINDDLVRESGKSFDAEAQILVVDKDYIGQGIGQAMLQNFKDYLVEQGLNTYYACTDTDSYFEFCESNGFTRCGSKKFGIPFVKKTQVDLFLYGASVN